MTETPIASHHATLDLRDHIRGIPDFPKPGILFYDISTLLRHGPAWRAAMERLAAIIRPYKPDLLAGIAWAFPAKWLMFWAAGQR